MINTAFKQARWILLYQCIEEHILFGIGLSTPLSSRWSVGIWNYYYCNQHRLLGKVDLFGIKVYWRTLLAIWKLEMVLQAEIFNACK